MARPLKEKFHLTRYFAFKTTEEAGRVWDAKIAASGLSASEFIRKAVEKNATVIKATVITPTDQRISFLLSQQSNNINQIARSLNVAHKAGTVSPHLYMDVLEQLETIATVAKNWRP